MRTCTAFLFLLAFIAGASENPFQGKWKLDKKASAATAGGPEFREVEIERDGNEILIKSKYVEPKNGVYPLSWLGMMAYELKLNSDGSETVNLLGPFKHQSKTTMEGNTLVTDFIAANEAGEAVKGQWVRTISSDGRQMTCQVKTETSDGRSLDQTLVFRRK